MGGKLKGKAIHGVAALGAAAFLACASAAIAQSANPAPAVPGSGSGMTAGPASAGVGSQFEMVFWQSIDNGNDPALYEAYLGRYPDGTFASVARVKIAKLRQASGGAVVPDRGPVLAPPPAAVAPVSAPLPTAAPASTVTSARSSPAVLVARPAVVPVRVSSPVVPVPVPAAALPARIDAVSSDSASDSAALRRLLGVLGDSQRLPDASPLAPPPVFAPTSPILAAAAPVAYVTPVSAAPMVSVAGSTGLAIPQQAPSALPASAAAPASDLRPIVVGALPASFALPPKPALEAVPGLGLPASFCSAEARNQFHGSAYIPAVEAAKRNNDAAISYLRQLQEIYDRNQLTGDINPMNAVAAEARGWGPVAAAAFSAQSALVTAFGALMAVPITACEAPQ